MEIIFQKHKNLLKMQYFKSLSFGLEAQNTSIATLHSLLFGLEALKIFLKHFLWVHACMSVDIWRIISSVYLIETKFMDLYWNKIYIQGGKKCALKLIKIFISQTDNRDCMLAFFWKTSREWMKLFSWLMNYAQVLNELFL